MIKTSSILSILFFLISFSAFSQVSLPHSESFESGTGDWTQLTTDDFDWTINSGTTPTANTGPSDAFDGNDYIYLEATGNSNPSRDAGIECYFDFSGSDMPILSFNYHMYGTQVGNLRIFVNDGGGWTEIWNKFGTQGNFWYNHKICLNAYGNNSNVGIRFVGETLDSESSDIALDLIEVRNFSIQAINHTDVTCGGYADGDITIEVAGGFTPYQYSIDGGSTYTSSSLTTQSFTGLSGYDYNVEILDEGGCTLYGGMVEVSEPPIPNITIDKANVEPCPDDMNGLILINASGSNPAFSYSINGMSGPFQSLNYFENLDVGTYTITVKTDIGCYIDGGNTTITAPDQIVINDVIVDDVSTCFGDANGQIQVDASGGNIQLDYSINNGILFQAEDYFGGLPTGYYDIIVRDAEYCTVTVNDIFVAEPTEVEITAIHRSNITGCYGDLSGTISLEGTGGTGDLHYSINGFVFQDDFLFTNLPAGTYQAHIRDDNACTTDGITVEISQPDELILEDAVKTDVQSCFGSEDGEILITASGGTGTLYYSIDNGLTFQTSPLFTGLGQGTYYPFVKDENDCYKFHTPLYINQPEQLVINNVFSYDVNTCYGGDNGSIYITASMGTSPLSYSIDGGTTFQSGGAFVGTLTAGDYNVLVQDANGCQVSYSPTITISEPPEIIITNEDYTNATCYGYYDGTITVDAEGGSGSLFYSIDNGNSFPYPTSSIVSVDAGTYTITVTDDNGCRADGSTLTISEPDELLISSTNITDVEDCNSDDDGIIEVNATGGTEPYLYSLNYGTTTQTSNTFENLPAGTGYTPYVEDANGCYVVGNPQTIIEPPALYFNYAGHTNIVGCNGTENGSITITANGGTQPLSYSIDNGTTYYENDGIFSNLAAGTYTTTVQDAHGCTVIGSTQIISQPEEMVIEEINVSPVICNGQSNGQIEIIATGGQPALRYSINGGANFSLSYQFNTIAAGNYDIVVKDAYDCEVSESITVEQPDPFTIDDPIATDVSTCYGDETGTLTLMAYGGVTPYSFTYTRIGGISSPSQTNGFFNNVGAGNYYMTVNDANGCTQSTGLVVIEEPLPVSFEYYTVNNISCNGLVDGSIEMQGQGGTGTNYEYTINGGTDWSPTNLFDNLSEGDYLIGVQDENGCQNEYYIGANIVNPPQIEIFAVFPTEISCNGFSDGRIDIDAIGGVGDYQYSLNGTDFQTSDIFTNLEADTYYPTVQDANGCTDQAEPVTLEMPEHLGGFTASTEIGCDSLTVLFTPNTPDITFNWAFTPTDEFTNDVPQEFTFHNTTDEIMEFNVRGIALHGLCKDTAYTTITVYPSPNLNFELSENVLFYPDTTVQITNYTANYTDYNWDFGDGQTSTQTNPIEHSYNTCGEYLVTMSALNQYNCIAHQYDTVKVNALQPTASFLPSEISACQPAEISFRNNSNYSNKYTWNFGEGTYSEDENPIFVYDQADTYEVTLIAEGDCGTFSTVSKTITVHPSPTANFDVEPDTINTGKHARFYHDFGTENDLRFFWDFGDGDVSFDQSPSHLYSEPGSYQVMQVVASTNNCTDTLIMENAVFVVDDLIFTYPTAFSPNDDGLFETISPYYNMVEQCEVYIYNRNGAVVFYTKEPLNEPWDGRDLNGKLVQMDVYVWYAIGKYVGGSSLKEKGVITVIR